MQSYGPKDAFLNIENALMIYAGLILADKSVTQDEMDYVNKYLKALYPEELKIHFYQKFKEYIETNIPLTEIAKQINETYNYETKLFMMFKSFEIMVSDGIDEEETAYLRRLADAIHLQPADMSCIEQVFGVSQGETQCDQEPLPLSIREILVGNEDMNPDVYFTEWPLKLSIFQIDRSFYAYLQASERTVYVGNQPLMEKFLTRISPDTLLKMGTFFFSYTDLNFFFKIATTDFHLNKKPFYLHKDPVPVINEKQAGAIARLQFENLSLGLTLLTDESSITINDHFPKQGQRLHINDELRVDRHALNLRHFFHKQIRCELTISEDGLRIGNHYQGCDLVMSDNLANKWYIHIECKEDQVTLKKHHCPYDLFLQGKPISRTYTIHDGDCIYLNRNRLRFDLNSNKIIITPFHIETYTVDHVSYQVKDQLRVDELCVDASYGDMIGIMGPSGSGKTTLLNLMVGLQAPTHGRVLVDNVDLHDNWSLLKKVLGYVPQDDYLFRELTVWENLYFSARLRFPGKSEEELRSLATRTLSEIDLHNQKEMIVGDHLNNKISGGQRKRLNIGLELLSDASIYFFDEPTSGLSSFDSDKIVSILRTLAAEGRIVFCVIHQPDSDLYKKFNKLILIDKGGKLAYFGDSREAIHYFKNHSFKAHNDSKVECPECNRLNPNLLLSGLEEPLQNIDGSVLNQRKYSPQYWKDLFSESNQSPILNLETAGNEDHRFYREKKRALTLWANFRTLMHRNLLAKFRNRSNLVMTFVISPLLALICSFILRFTKPSSENYSLFNNEHLGIFLFVSVIIVVFLAIANSVEEIIRERHIIKREKLFDINIANFYISKLLTLLLFAGFQNGLYILISFYILEIRELHLSFWALFMLVSLIGIAGGLLISSIPFLNTKAAFNIVPLILIPQIILGGSLIKFKEMNQDFDFGKDSPIPEVCHLMPSRWAFEASILLFDSFNRYQRPFDKAEQTKIDINERLTLLENQGLPENETQIAALDQQLKAINKTQDTLRQKVKGDYGNNDIHIMVDDAELWLESIQKDRPTFWDYPMGVRQKTLPWINLTVPTHYFNGLVLFLGFLILASGNLILLKLTL